MPCATSTTCMPFTAKTASTCRNKPNIFQKYQPYFGVLVFFFFCNFGVLKNSKLPVNPWGRVTLLFMHRARPGRWPPWAYGALGAGYALAAGFSAIYVAPRFMGPLEVELDEAPPRGAPAATRTPLVVLHAHLVPCAGPRACGAAAHRVSAHWLLTRALFDQAHREERRPPELARLAAVASAVAKSQTIDGTTTYAAAPPPTAGNIVETEGDAAVPRHAPAADTAPHAAESAVGGGSERDLTYDEVCRQRLFAVPALCAEMRACD